MDYAGTPGDDNIDSAALKLPPGTRILAGAGDDLVITTGYMSVELGPGNDRLHADGQASLVYWNSPAGIRVDMSAGIAADGYGSHDSFSGVRTVFGSGWNDYFKGGARQTEFWVMGGSDTVDGVSGLDVAVISTSSSAGSPIFNKTQTGWLVNYVSPHQSAGSVALNNVGYVREWIDVTHWRMWDLTGDVPRQVPERGTVFEPAPGLPQEGMWRVDQWAVVVQTTNEQHGAYYYPTVHDYHAPGFFSYDLHNAAVGDFNGDGRQDLVVNWTVFPHTVERTTPVLPQVLLNMGGKLVLQPAASMPATLDRHMAYRTVAGDFNGDGLDDFAAGGGGVITRNPSVPGGFISSWEPAMAVLSGTSGAFIDVSDHMAGQTLTSPSPRASFMHDFSAGDVNNDGFADLFGGGRLWLTDGPANWADRTSLLGTLLPSGPPMTSAMGDLDGKGGADLVVLYPDFNGSRIALLNSGTPTTAFTQVTLPSGLFGSNTKDNFVLIADVNRDGLGDIVVAETRAEPYYRGSAIQILVQTSAGVFEDQTATRIDNAARDSVHGEGILFFVDANGDGHPDLIHVNAEWTGIFLNDGIGNFSLFDIGNLPFIQPWQLDGWQDTARDWPQVTRERAYPIHIDDDGIIDFVAQIREPLSTWPQQEPSVTAVYTMISSSNAFDRDRAEVLNGSQLADVIYGLGGDDVITGRGGNDRIDGGHGLDVAAYSKERGQYEVTISSSSVIVRDRNGVDGVDTLTSIERLRFADSQVALDIDGNAGTAYRLYKAAFDRLPDLPGLGYQMNDLDIGVPLRQVASNFIASPEFQATYGTVSDAQFVTLLYRNVLDREPEPEGLAYHVARLANPGVIRADILIGFSESPENKANVIGLIENGMEYIW